MFSSNSNDFASSSSAFKRTFTPFAACKRPTYKNLTFVLDARIAVGSGYLFAFSKTVLRYFFTGMNSAAASRFALEGEQNASRAMLDTAANRSLPIATHVAQRLTHSLPLLNIPPLKQTRFRSCMK